MARAKGRFSALKSSVPGKVPQNTQIEFGEFAVNIADGTIYFKIIDPVDPTGNPDGQVISVSGSLPPTFLSLTDTPSDYIGQDGKMLVVDETNGVLTFADVPSGVGSSYQFGDGLVLNNTTTPPTVNVVGGNGITVTPASVNVNFGTTAGTVAEGNHTHSISIDDLTDVDTSTNTPSVGDTLKWDGSNWVTGVDNDSGARIEYMRVDYRAGGTIGTITETTGGIDTTSIVSGGNKVEVTFLHDGPPKSILFYGFKLDVDGNGNSGYKVVIPNNTTNDSFIVSPSGGLPSLSPGKITIHCSYSETQADVTEHAYVYFLY